MKKAVTYSSGAAACSKLVEKVIHGLFHVAAEFLQSCDTVLKCGDSHAFNLHGLLVE